ncbi:hydrolase [Actinomyces sp. HMSC075C01]|uniref:Hydrolase n=1 Tax=Actinomyces oris TaxID=544580 RepID=A0A1Q8VUF8_9ACTO|nr:MULTISPECIES: zinc-dependent metalloprotease [Actinomyces]OFR49319.1 hydrolase [Actinomyces sp. HMSC075C01]OLO51696.1 hydrolase [Actinomyces oris]
MTTQGTAAGLVDWRTVERLSALIPAGPSASRSARASSVAVLRRSAQEAPAWVARITGLNRAAQQAAETTRVSVVDRAGLVRASTRALRGLMEQVPAPRASEAIQLVGAAEIAGAMSLLATRLLGQVLPAAPSGPHGHGAGAADVAPPAGEGADVAAPATAPARDVTMGAGWDGAASPHLLLVAPNVLAVRRQMDLDMLDLPAWVCLHEMTHAVQLAAAPWLGPYLSDSMRMVIGAVVEAVYGGADGAGGTSPRGRGSLPWRGRAVRLAARAGRGRVLESLMNVTDRAEVASLAAALTFLEGHAEVVLDDVHPNRMPSVHRLRAVLSRSRAADGGIGPGPGLGSLLLHRLMGLEAKEAQYADGAAFVRSVVTRIGHEGLNAVWADPGLLPTPAELARPDVWVRRIS